MFSTCVERYMKVVLLAEIMKTENLKKKSMTGFVTGSFTKVYKFAHP